MFDEAFMMLWLRLASAAAFIIDVGHFLVRPRCRGPLEGALPPAPLPWLSLLGTLMVTFVHSLPLPLGDDASLVFCLLTFWFQLAGKVRLGALWLRFAVGVVVPFRDTGTYPQLASGAVTFGLLPS